MIRTRFTKSAMENEEGLNHLWIHLAPIGRAENAEEEIGGLQVDEEAAAFVTKLKQRHGGESPAFIDFTQTKIIRLGSNEYSDLEKKYRIEGNLC